LLLLLHHQHMTIELHLLLHILKILVVLHPLLLHGSLNLLVVVVRRCVGLGAHILSPV